MYINKYKGKRIYTTIDKDDYEEFMNICDEMDLNPNEIIKSLIKIFNEDVKRKTTK